MSVDFQNFNLGLNNLNGVILLMCVLSKTKFIRRVSVISIDAESANSTQGIMIQCFITILFDS